MIVDGRRVAHDILARLKEHVSHLPEAPTICAIVVNPQPATKSYLRIKEQQAAAAGMSLHVKELPSDVTTEGVVESILQSVADAIIVQLPLPTHIDTTAVLDSIPQERDADVLSHAARKAFSLGRGHALLPPVVAAVKNIFDTNEVATQNKKAVVIGDGWLVGNPVAIWLKNQGADVTTITLEYGDLTMLKDADIIVTGAGSPLLVQPHMIKEGVVLIDAGTSEVSGALLGDIDPVCAERASVFTPVPGGVGPIAVACLFQNVLALVHSNQQ